VSNQSAMLFDKAELALAAYSALTPGRTDDQTDDLENTAGAGMSRRQALDFARRRHERFPPTVLPPGERRRTA
jgi:hypothetical protein